LKFRNLEFRPQTEKKEYLENVKYSRQYELLEIYKLRSKGYTLHYYIQKIVLNNSDNKRQGKERKGKAII